MTQRLDIKHISQLKQHHSRHFPTSTPVATGMDMDDLFVPEPLHRHIMLSASAEEHGRSPRFHCPEV